MHTLSYPLHVLEQEAHALFEYSKLQASQLAETLSGYTNDAIILALAAVLMGGAYHFITKDVDQVPGT